MKKTLSWLYFITLIVAGGIGIVALLNWFYNEHRPLWIGPILMLVAAIGTSAMSYARNKGWITSGFLSKSQRSERQDLEARKQALAAQRDAIIAEAKAKA